MFKIDKANWVLLGGLAIGGIIGVYLLHSVVPVKYVAKNDPKVISTIEDNPFDNAEGWNWSLDTEKIAKTYTREATQDPYWRYMANEYYSAQHVY